MRWLGAYADRRKIYLYCVHGCNEGSNSDICYTKVPDFLKVTFLFDTCHYLLAYSMVLFVRFVEFKKKSTVVPNKIIRQRIQLRNVGFFKDIFPEIRHEDVCTKP